MAKLDLVYLRDLFTRERILICFNGPFSHSIIEELGKAVKSYLESENQKKSVIMDVFAVFVEQTQNVRNYTASAALAETDQQGILIIGKHDDKYAVSAGNLVRAADVAPLIGKLERLKGLDKTELKALYKEQMRLPLAPDGAGAGLGLIDMARRASEPLHHTVEPIDGDYAFFSLRVVI